MRPAPRSLVSIDTDTIDLHQMPRDETAFCDWLADAGSGAALAYYRGHLGFDRAAPTSSLTHDRRRRLDRLAGRVLTAARSGFVHLVQRRAGHNDWIYIAVRARHLAPPSLPTALVAPASMPLAANDAFAPLPHTHAA